MSDKRYPDAIYDSIKRLAVKKLLEDIRKHQDEQGWSDEYAPPQPQIPIQPSPSMPELEREASPLLYFEHPDEWERTNPFRKLLNYKL